jgi:hypothetical protein
MAIKLFKRKSKKEKKEKKEKINQNVDQDNTSIVKQQSQSIVEPVGHSASTTEESIVSLNLDPNDGLFIQSRPEEVANDEAEDYNVPKIISGRDGADKFKVSDVRDTMLHNTEGFKAKRTKHVPSARDSAYSGPPRYDWIDVEAAAAIKVQSIFRRHLVLTQLEREGKSTAAMRNKIRSRHAEKKALNSEDVPLMFRFCGIGFLFADATGEDTQAINEGIAAKRDEKFNSKINKDKKLRAFRMRQKTNIELEEAVEVVDNIDDE